MVFDRLTGHKATVRRFLEEEHVGDRVDEYDEVCTADYLEHDPTVPRETIGLDEAREQYRLLSQAFELRHTVESMVAERELVGARYTVRGRHVGEFQGRPPTGRTFEVTGQVTLRFRDERIAETWFITDIQGLMEQLGYDSA